MKCLIAKLTLPAVMLAVSLSTPAQSLPKLDDPANLAGERVSAPDLADTLPINHGAPALEQLLRKLRTRASFMLIVAHPDDEDGGMLTYLSRGQGARVAMLTLTRGEGGQNLMSGDFEDALGLIRTQELLAADRYMGVDQFFGTEVDFGFSKTKEESFAKWTHDRVLYDAVRAVRLYRPLVIGSVFIGAATDGHGQHQVSGEIAQEVFKAAGDPKVFPDQGLPPWQPLKVYARIPFARIDAQGMFDYATNQYATPRFENYVTGKVTEAVPAANVMVPEGTTDALLGGLSYVQFARQGLALQKTQIGPGVRTAPAGRADIRYHRYGSRVVVDGKLQPDDGADTGMESGFFDGIDTSLPGIATLAPDAPPTFKASLQVIDGKIDEAQKQFDPAKPSAIADPLRVALQTLDTVISGTEGSKLPLEQKANVLHELRVKRVQLNDVLVLAYGLKLDDESTNEVITARNALPTSVHVSATTPSACVLNKMWLQNAEGAISGDNQVRTPEPLIGETFNARLVVANEQNPFDTAFTNTVTKPYFVRKDIERPVYDILNPALRDAPASPPAFTVHAQISCDGSELQLASIVHVIQSERPLNVMPSLNVLLEPKIKVLPAGAHNVQLVAIDKSFGSRAYPTGICDPVNCNTKLQANGVQTPNGLRSTITMTVPVQLLGKPYEVRARGFSADQPKIVTDVEGSLTAGYPGIPSTTYYEPAITHVVPVDVTTAPNLNVAYLAGTGDDVISALNDLGVSTHTITVVDLTPDKLKQYDAVVLGVRAYEAHRDLLATNDVLSAYAAAGGVVVMQYNTRLPSGVSPFPLTLDHTENVVDETAPVAILDPADPLLNWPNKITAADFSGWIEERGHGFMSSWDPHFKPLLETHDPGQQPQQGGLLVARTGKGAWIYLGLALYRQLPEGVPGSYRILANLISAGKQPR